MTRRLIIGIDPGPVPGVAALWNASESPDNPQWNKIGFSFAQCDPDSMMDLIREWANPFCPNKILIATERFVTSNRTARSAHAHAAQLTQDILGGVREFANTAGIERVNRPAATVKPWSSNARLDAAGLLKYTVGSTHARDATRHLLYAACHDCGFPDPLSKKVK